MQPRPGFSPSSFNVASTYWSRSVAGNRTTSPSIWEGPYSESSARPPGWWHAGVCRSTAVPRITAEVHSPTTAWRISSGFTCLSAILFTWSPWTRSRAFRADFGSSQRRTTSNVASDSRLSSRSRNGRGIVWSPSDRRHERRPRRLTGHGSGGHVPWHWGFGAFGAAVDGCRALGSGWGPVAV